MFVCFTFCILSNKLDLFEATCFIIQYDLKQCTPLTPVHKFGGKMSYHMIL